MEDRQAAEWAGAHPIPLPFTYKSPATQPPWPKHLLFEVNWCKVWWNPASPAHVYSKQKWGEGCIQQSVRTGKVLGGRQIVCPYVVLCKHPVRGKRIGLTNRWEGWQREQMGSWGTYLFAAPPWEHFRWPNSWAAPSLVWEVHFYLCISGFSGLVQFPPFW